MHGHGGGGKVAVVAQWWSRNMAVRWGYWEDEDRSIESLESHRTSQFLLQPTAEFHRWIYDRGNRRLRKKRNERGGGGRVHRHPSTTWVARPGVPPPPMQPHIWLLSRHLPLSADYI
ncbi:hypothetical protein NL676_011726 [Syzygium grande]|nr:hypothetical protein NL676_011726 [Syzygium grande]